MSNSKDTARQDEQEMVRRLLDDDLRVGVEGGAGDFQELRQMLGDSLRSRVRYLGMLGFVLTLAFLAVAVVSAVQFFQTPEADVRGLLLWATLFLVSTTQIVLVKVWFWINWNRNSVVREIKRLELRLVAGGRG